MSGNEVGVDGAFDSAASDDWGAFESVLTQLEQEEKASEAQEADTGAEIDEKSMTVILGGLFGMVEKMTGAIAGVPFAFDEDQKQSVIEAAIPVMESHGEARWVTFFGKYAQEGALLIAVIVLVVGARSTLQHQKRLQREAAHDAEKANADSVQQPD